MVHTFFYVIVFLIIFDAYSDFLWKWSSWSLILVYIYMTQAQDWTLETLHELERQQYLCKKLNKYVCNHNPLVMQKKIILVVFVR